MSRATAERWVNAALLLAVGAVAGFVVGASTAPPAPTVLLPPPTHVRAMTPCVLVCSTPPPATPVWD